MTLAQLAVEIAVKEIGVTEEPRGSNCGPQVDKYLQSVMLPPGYPWCAAFVHWCFDRAAGELKIANPLPRTGSVLAMWQAVAVYQKRIPQPGAVFCIQTGHGVGHCGIVRSIEGQRVITIEGNTNTDGSRDGYGVFERKRRTAGVNNTLGFLVFP